MLNFKACMLSCLWHMILSSLFNFKLLKTDSGTAGCSLIGDCLLLGVVLGSCSLSGKQSELCDGSGEEMSVCVSHGFGW